MSRVWRSVYRELLTLLKGFEGRKPLDPAFKAVLTGNRSIPA